MHLAADFDAYNEKLSLFNGRTMFNSMRISTNAQLKIIQNFSFIEDSRYENSHSALVWVACFLPVLLHFRLLAIFNQGFRSRLPQISSKIMLARLAPQ